MGGLGGLGGGTPTTVAPNPSVATLRIQVRYTVSNACRAASSDPPSAVTSALARSAAALASRRFCLVWNS